MDLVVSPEILALLDQERQSGRAVIDIDTDHIVISIAIQGTT